MSDQNSSSAERVTGGVAHSDAFREAMASAHTRCAQLNMATDRHDFEDCGYRAEQAVNVWLAGRVACRRLLERANPESPFCDAARKLLALYGTEILASMKRAATTIEVPSMQHTLEDLRRMLTTAMSEPLEPSTGGRSA